MTQPETSERKAEGQFAGAHGSEALSSVIHERERQEAKWGEQNHKPETWLVILGEEVGEACEATLEMDWNAYRAEMVQVAAVAVAAVEACDRALGVPPSP